MNESMWIYYHSRNPDRLYVEGVPLADLSADFWEQLKPWEREAVRKSGWYELGEGFEDTLALPPVQAEIEVIEEGQENG